MVAEWPQECGAPVHVVTDQVSECGQEVDPVYKTSGSAPRNPLLPSTPRLLKVP